MSRKKHQTSKTNAMRILDREGISYEALDYEYDESDLSGVHAAQITGLPEEEIFKTLVTRSNDKEIVVFVIPVAESLDLKKAAKTAGVKKVEMIHVKEIEELTGYIRGGCSPIGMKKQYRTFLHQSAESIEKIYVSAGRRGLQMRIGVGDLLKVTGGAVADLTT